MNDSLDRVEDSLDQMDGRLTILVEEAVANAFEQIKEQSSDNEEEKEQVVGFDDVNETLSELE